MDVLSSAQKSTTVRSLKWGARSLALRSLEPVAPAAAVNLAARWFCTPDRHAVAETPGWADGARRFDVRLGDDRLAAWSWGSGPTAILVHGWNGRASQLAPLARALAANGRRAVVFDHPAHGASTGTVTAIPQMAQAIAAVAEVSGGADALIAHSLGAVAAAVAMARGLAVDRAVFVAAPVDPWTWIDRFVTAVGLPAPSAPQIHDAVAALAGAAAAEISPLALARKLADIDLLLLHDRADREVPLSAGVSLAAAWPGAHLVCTSGLGHNRILRDPGVVRVAATFVATGDLAQSLQPLIRREGWDVRDPQLAAAVERVVI